MNRDIRRTDLDRRIRSCAVHCGRASSYWQNRRAV